MQNTRTSSYSYLHPALKKCYNNSNGHAVFRGRVSAIGGTGGNDVRYLMEYVNLMYDIGNKRVISQEDHVWIFDAKQIRDLGIKANDSISFEGDVVPYTRKDGYNDYGITKPSNICKIAG